MEAKSDFKKKAGLSPKLPRLTLPYLFALYLFSISIVPLIVVGSLSYDISRSVIQEEVSKYTQDLVRGQQDSMELLLDPRGCEKQADGRSPQLRPNYPMERDRGQRQLQFQPSQGNNSS